MDLLNDERVLDQFSSHFWDWVYIFLVIQSPKVLTKRKDRDVILEIKAEIRYGGVNNVTYIWFGYGVTPTFYLNSH